SASTPPSSTAPPNQRSVLDIRVGLAYISPTRNSMKQLTLDKVIRKPRRGKAKGGRPPKNGVKAGVSHLRRPVLNGQRHPVHVTLRMLPHVWNLRSRRCFGAIARSFYAA